MNLQEIAHSCNIPLKRLHNYENEGLLHKHDEKDYQMQDIKQLGLLETLIQIGFNIKEIKRYLAVNHTDHSAEKQIQLLRDKRTKILEIIHSKQTLLDSVDYLIWNIKKGVGKNE